MWKLAFAVLGFALLSSPADTWAQWERRGGLLLDQNGDWFGHPEELASAGLVLDEDGEWVPPTPEAAIRLFLDGGADLMDLIQRQAAAKAVLTERFETRTRRELDAFVAELVRIALSDSEPVDIIWDVETILASVGHPRHESPYEGGFDQLRRIHEARVDRVPVEARNDPFQFFHDLHRASEWSLAERGRASRLMRGTLLSLYQVEPEGRGLDYLLRIIGGAPPPTEETWEPRETTWCEVQDYLFWHVFGQESDSDETARADALDYLRELGLDADRFARFCGGNIIRITTKVKKGTP